MKKITALIALCICLSTQSFAQTKVTFYTNQGNFEVEMYDSLMPITVGNFLSLVDTNFYDGIIFHRVISNFVIQGGDPLGTGFGGPGYTIPDEFDSTGQLSNIKQTLSMANAGPNTGGSQFFINLKNNVFLDYDKNPLTSAHPIFGIVRSGWNTVTTIAAVPVDSNDRPIADVVMDSLRVTGSYLSDEELEWNKTLSKVYPNPATPESVLDVFMVKPAEVALELHNQEGQLMAQTRANLPQGKTQVPLTNLNVNGLQNGVYFLWVKSPNAVQCHKILVVH